MSLEEPFRRAVEQLGQIDPAVAAHSAGVQFNPREEYFSLPFLNRVYRVQYPGGQVKLAGEPADSRITVLLLHYLLRASGGEVAGPWISFQELPGGAIYIDPFKRRALQPLLARFGANPHALLPAGEKLGGHRGESGDVSLVLPVLPRVPLQVVLWEGDEEFPANGTILFDAVTPYYLPTEDCAVLAQLVARELVDQV